MSQLPTSDEKNTAHGAVLQPDDKDIFFKPRVLVVDDEERIQKACHRLLTREGCDVAMADNGIKGLKMIDEAHFDIVLLDLMMPGMSGMDVLTGIKARHGYRDYCHHRICHPGAFHRNHEKRGVRFFIQALFPPGIADGYIQSH